MPAGIVDERNVGCRLTLDIGHVYVLIRVREGGTTFAQLVRKEICVGGPVRQVCVQGGPSDCHGAV